MSGCAMGSPAAFPPAGDGTCCISSAVYGPERCSCWEPEYDLEQTPPRTDVEPATRARMCPGCAYRPDSPEQTGAEDYAGDAVGLEAMAAVGSRPFWCHEGMRKPLRYRHPDGQVVDGHEAQYEPPIVDGVPYQATGEPAERCAGWAARRRALAARTEA